ncbi:MAG TPA: HAMP domain-containing protein, partial [Actinomycetota bacterium]
MTLRARLTLFFAGIVVVPLVAATLVLQILVTQEVRRRSDARLEAASATLSTLWQERLTVAERETGRAASVAAELLPGRGTALEERIEVERSAAGLDFLVVTNPQGGIIASSVGSPLFARGVTPPTAFDIVGERSVPGLLRARAPISVTGNLGDVVGGWFVDTEFLRELVGPADVELVLRSGMRVLAATESSLGNLPARGPYPLSVGDGRRVTATQIRGQSGEVVLVTPEEVADVHGAVWGVAVLGLLIASMLGYLLAGVIGRPVYELAEGARRVAAGDLHTRVAVGDRGDIGNLANAFNQMTENLETYVTRLEESRDELRRNLDRLGATLRSTHDLDAMLSVIVDTAAATLHASTAALFLLTPSGKRLRLQAVLGYEPSAVTEM